MLPFARTTQARIHLDRLVANYRLAGELSGKAGVMAVCKADAYGHGAVICARALQEDAGCRLFGVATLGEAVELRLAGIEGDILLMGALFPGEEEEAFHHDITCTVYDIDVADRIQKAAARLDRRVPVHLKIETGMVRLGFDADVFSEFLSGLTHYRNLNICGVFTHLAEADRPDGLVTAEQFSKLQPVYEVLKKHIGNSVNLHIMNSSALLQKHGPLGDIVRPGLMLYGAYPSPWQRANAALHPVMELVSTVIQIQRIGVGQKVSYGGSWIAGRNSTIGVVAAGYADGVPRLLSNQGSVLVAGHRVPIVGRVCMDMLMIDLTDIDGVGVGAEVVLLGRRGELEITTDDWAEWASTVPYEILTGITQRVPRIYSGAGATKP